MPRTKGAKGKVSKSVKEQIERAFNRVNNPKNNPHSVSWLEYQAWNNPAVFAGMVAKIIPAQVNVEASIGVDLGAALLQANARAETALQHEHDQVDMIDVTPIENATDCKD